MDIIQYSGKTEENECILQHVVIVVLRTLSQKKAPLNKLQQYSQQACLRLLFISCRVFDSIWKYVVTYNSCFSQDEIFCAVCKEYFGVLHDVNLLHEMFFGQENGDAGITVILVEFFSNLFFLYLQFSSREKSASYALLAFSSAKQVLCARE